MFEITFRPGKLGIRLRSKPTVLYEGQDAVECAYFDSIEEEDKTITGPGRQIALLQREPSILTVNGESVVGMEYQQVRKVIEEATRPLLLRCQIGVAPTVLPSTHSPCDHFAGPNSSSSSGASSIVLLPRRILPAKEDDIDNQKADMQDWNLSKNQEEEKKGVGICRYYHWIVPSLSVESTKKEEEEEEEEVRKNATGNERLNDHLGVGRILKD